MTDEIDIEKIADVVARVVTSEGLEYVNADLRGAGPHAKLRVTIDRPEGVTHEDCALVSTQLDTILDVEELIPFAYTLEVTSPGLGRSLASFGSAKKDVEKEFQRHAGDTVRVRAAEPVAGRTSVKGRVERVTPDGVTIVERTGEQFTIPYTQIVAANVVQAPTVGRGEEESESADE